jgi:hypothetical protein
MFGERPRRSYGDITSTGCPLDLPPSAMSRETDDGIPNPRAGATALAAGIGIDFRANRYSPSGRRVPRQRSRSITPLADRLGPLIAPSLEPMELLPNPPLTRDQVRLLKTDKVVSRAEPTLGELGVQPQPVEEFLAGLQGQARQTKGAATDMFGLPPLRHTPTLPNLPVPG